MILQAFWNASCCLLKFAMRNSWSVRRKWIFSQKCPIQNVICAKSHISHAHVHAHTSTVCSSFQSFVIVRSAAFYLSHVSRCVARSLYELINCHPGKKAAHMINEKRQLCWLWAPKRPTAIFDMKMNRRTIFSGWQFGVIFRSHHQAEDTKRKRIQNT